MSGTAERDRDRAALDPHVRRLVGALSLGGPRGVPLPDVAQRREAFRRLMQFSETGTVVAGVEDGTLPGPAGPLRIRIYTPRGVGPGPMPGLVFIHGGGMIAGDLDTHDALCRAMCNETACRLVAVDYRLAPEHPFPAAIDDAHAAVAWVLAQAGVLGVDPARIGIAGDSAGATMAVAVCHRLARTPTIPLKLQLLLCPILDWATEAPSRRDFGDGFLLDRALMRQELACYLGQRAQADHPEVSPLHADDLAGQPPALIHTAELDPFRDEGRTYAEKLRAAGVSTRYVCHSGMVHLFYGLAGVVPYARSALQRIGAEIKAALA